MPWLRIGDDASTHPKMFRLLEACGYNHALKNEAFGILVTAATVSAAHLEDYVVSPGLVATFAPGREKTIIDALVAAELAEWTTVDDRKVIRLIEDEDFIHMRSREEVEIDRGRKADLRDMSLIIPVRVRDGDQCRWCGRTVNWFDRKGTRGGTIDSLSGHKLSTVDTLVVACRGCNSRRGNGTELELRPEPQNPYYDEKSIAWINNNQWAKDNGIHVTPKQTSLDLATAQAAHEADDQAAASTETAAPARGHGAPECNRLVKPGPDLGHAGDGTGFAGSGRGGKVSVRSGETSAYGHGRSRKRRGRRSGRNR